MSATRRRSLGPPRDLTIGDWVARKDDQYDMAQVRNNWRHEKRIQLVRDLADQSPFSLTYDELRRDWVRP